MHTIHGLCRACIGQNLPQVTVLRGKDGFGFTICSDSPVRVQAVDQGSPSHQAGLQQGDSILQLNGLPVEQWKCVDLAQAIRNCHSEISMVVWRSLPVMKPYFEGLIHQPSYKPPAQDGSSPQGKSETRPPLCCRGPRAAWAGAGPGRRARGGSGGWGPCGGTRGRSQTTRPGRTHSKARG
ncbi:regulator of G-protein signaling 3-like isoform X2 [Osmerus eperlanus]|uniref:regulator of G-protein signaling 3-like isoform X2 n=1 Tax=Osmerus eperlanus TaxID=29151 RepID=UPI002E1262A8